MLRVEQMDIHVRFWRVVVLTVGFKILNLSVVLLLRYSYPALLRTLDILPYHCCSHMQRLSYAWLLRLMVNS